MSKNTNENENDLSLYRPCVGITLLNQNNHIFMGERIDTPGAWQMPQGGIDAGEDILNAAYRELKEETGTDKAIVLDKISRPLRYELPIELQKKLWNGQFKGQAQYWIAMRFNGKDSDINIHAFQPPEFMNWQWTEPEEVLDLIVPFKRNVYQIVLQKFRDL